jgi:hypothetical protein
MDDFAVKERMRFLHKLSAPMQRGDLNMSCGGDRLDSDLFFFCTGSLLPNEDLERLETAYEGGAPFDPKRVRELDVRDEIRALSGLKFSCRSVEVSVLGPPSIAEVKQVILGVVAAVQRATGWVLAPAPDFHQTLGDSLIDQRSGHHFSTTITKVLDVLLRRLDGRHPRPKHGPLLLRAAVEPAPSPAQEWSRPTTRVRFRVVQETRPEVSLVETVAHFTPREGNINAAKRFMTKALRDARVVNRAGEEACLPALLDLLKRRGKILCLCESEDLENACTDAVGVFTRNLRQAAEKFGFGRAGDHPVRPHYSLRSVVVGVATDYVKRPGDPVREFSLYLDANPDDL